MDKNRRVYQRLDGIANIRYTVKGRDKGKIESLPRDIGGGGVGICLTEELPRGTRLELEITVPDNPQKAILVVGEVLWTKLFGIIKAGRRVNLYATGVKFIDIDPIALGRVYTYYRQMGRV